VYPSGKFGANAAWLRLQVLTLNLLELLKAAGLDPELRQARPKRLRFVVFTQCGRGRSGCDGGGGHRTNHCAQLGSIAASGERRRCAAHRCIAGDSPRMPPARG
jgi:hypothetical protein